jgi:hypothetical protein
MGITGITGIFIDPMEVSHDDIRNLIQKENAILFETEKKEWRIDTFNVSNEVLGFLFIAHDPKSAERGVAYIKETNIYVYTISAAVINFLTKLLKKAGIVFSKKPDAEMPDWLEKIVNHAIEMDKKVPVYPAYH